LGISEAADNGSRASYWLIFYGRKNCKANS
jgi:hypothetical protein